MDDQLEPEYNKKSDSKMIQNMKIPITIQAGETMCY